MGCCFSNEDEYPSSSNRQTSYCNLQATTRTYNRGVTHGNGITTPYNSTAYSVQRNYPSGSNRQTSYCNPQATTRTYNHGVTHGNGITTSYNSTAYSVQRNQHQQPKKVASTKPELGEYKCVCGRFWTSRYCWSDKYQNCKKCKRHVYPHLHRELKSSDFTKDNSDKPHEKELCEKCQQLGYSCTTKNTH